MKCIKIVFISLLVMSCDKAEYLQNRNQEKLNLETVESVPLPSITNFTEKRMLKNILELRDKVITTYTYVRDFNGKLHFLCRSIGFGIPYSTQYTNPLKRIQASNVVVKQVDPNGLYQPESSEGTWVNCLNPKTQMQSIVYIEDRITVSSFPLE